MKAALIRWVSDLQNLRALALGLFIYLGTNSLWLCLAAWAFLDFLVAFLTDEAAAESEEEDDGDDEEEDTTPLPRTPLPRYLNSRSRTDLPR